MGGAVGKNNNPTRAIHPNSGYLKNSTERENLQALKEFGIIQLQQPSPSKQKQNNSQTIFEFANSDIDVNNKKRSNSEARYQKFDPFECGHDKNILNICSPHRLPKLKGTYKQTNQVILFNENCINIFF